MRRQAAYLRVSTAQQNEALQREAIQRAVSARGETVELWFTEKRSGAKLDRPELERVRALARRGELAQLWVFRLDRLARGALYLATVVRELRDHGCRVVSVSEGIDTGGPWADGMMALLGMFGEMELEAIRERTAAARKKAEAAGKRWGRPPAGSRDQRAYLRQLLDSGLTLRGAAKEAGLSYGTAQRILAGDGQGVKR